MEKHEIASIYLRLLEEVNTTVQLAMETLHHQTMITRLMVESLLEEDLPTTYKEVNEHFYDGSDDDEIEF